MGIMISYFFLYHPCVECAKYFNKNGGEPPMDYPNHALSLREWLDHLQRTDRLAVAKPGLSLRHEIAGVANRMDGRKATLFPKAGGQDGTVVSGIVSDRNWMAEALGIAPGELVSRFGKASAEPLAWKELKKAPCQEVVHRDVDIFGAITATAFGIDQGDRTDDSVTRHQWYADVRAQVEAAQQGEMFGIVRTCLKD